MKEVTTLHIADLVIANDSGPFAAVPFHTEFVEDGLRHLRGSFVTTVPTPSGSALHMAKDIHRDDGSFIVAHWDAIVVAQTAGRTEWVSNGVVHGCDELVAATSLVFNTKDTDPAIDLPPQDNAGFHVTGIQNVEEEAPAETARSTYEKWQEAERRKRQVR